MLQNGESYRTECFHRNYKSAGFLVYRLVPRSFYYKRRLPGQSRVKTLLKQHEMESSGKDSLRLGVPWVVGLRRTGRSLCPAARPGPTARPRPPDAGSGDSLCSIWGSFCSTGHCTQSRALSVTAQPGLSADKRARLYSGGCAVCSGAMSTRKFR